MVFGLIKNYRQKKKHAALEDALNLHEDVKCYLFNMYSESDSLVRPFHYLSYFEEAFNRTGFLDYDHEYNVMNNWKMILQLETLNLREELDRIRDMNNGVLYIGNLYDESQLSNERYLHSLELAKEIIKISLDNNNVVVLVACITSEEMAEFYKKQFNAARLRNIDIDVI